MPVSGAGVPQYWTQPYGGEMASTVRRHRRQRAVTRSHAKQPGPQITATRGDLVLAA